MIEREEDIQEHLRLGQDIGQFSQSLATKYNCSKHSIERQCRGILKDMANMQKENREELRVKLMLRNDHLYNRALADGKIKVAIDAVNLQAKIGGLYQPDKEEAEEKPQAPSFSFSERNNAIPLAVVPEDDDGNTGTD